ncbi:sucrose transport protein SUC3-like isoform X1 [Silene latifolia]|uniref:sucrose transport protein SUC3-like isoform X1 n=1 Tax=Silene latifolia TaxID=37657 RepID=UPI003D785CD9
MAEKPDSATAIRVPYQNLKRTVGVEMIGFNDDSRDSNGGGGDCRSENTRLLTLILTCTVAAGVQFGWALQLSLLTPYIQTLGIGHAFSSFIWLCGPITGLVVQPCVGIWSDKCTSKYGRRRPFILAGSLMISIAVIIIGFSADIGYLLGDTREHCSTFKGTRTRAALVFVVGFWLLDLANNTVQGPARALLADLSGPDQRNAANAVFASWMAVGNILGFSAGASGNWHKWFPFLINRACCEACGNLKAAFLVAVFFLTLCTSVTLYFAKEIPLEASVPQRLSDSAPLLDDPQRFSMDLSKSMGKESTSLSYSENVRRVENHLGSEESRNEDHMDVDLNDGPGSFMVKLLTSLRHLPSAMHSVLIVTALTWFSWFPFFLFDTDWMGREVYHGNPIGNDSEIILYDRGVRAGAVGLLLNSVVLGVGSFLIEPMCRKMGTRVVWALNNFVVFVAMACIAVISLVSLKNYKDNSSTKAAALVVFAILGFPLSITYSVPYSVTAEVTAESGGGQGLALGVLNLAVVVPQMIISLGAGPWDALFGGGNIPAFILASLAAFAAGVIATLKLPNISGSFKSSGMHVG